ncbi:SDR family NAD(P)-dependent oxidoreductase [Paraliomyxa miuraensis]|uniref:SDR family NAD(P)-dependent oxidoreductase n=1 Tax=Paraliomyxa miuraensis TaxID=376150 RepID=UPI0022530F9D|nr:SDR family NAD(P)-dependent oxidoreductase [Paraliomyxa miuraensis]MCX4247176.1 SDR family NAD(P)-dependent oxidoreductase [Paraliomyxa miuraensis]
MARTIIVCGYGPGISSAVARKFGGEGFQVAIVARSAERLEAGVKALTDAGITAKAFPCDLGDVSAVQQLVADVRSSLGPITVVHWNAYGGAAGDLTTCDPNDFRKVLDVGVVGEATAVQAALPDLRAQEGAAVLVTGGGFAYYADPVDQMISQWNTMGVAVAKAAQHKLTGVLHQKLKADGIYVGSIVVMGLVKGTAFDQGGPGLDADDIAAAFWQLYQDRSDVYRQFPAQ